MDEGGLRALIERDPYNPHHWTEVVRVAENSGNYSAVVRAYEGFLSRFPLMHIYWDKWAKVVHAQTRSIDDALEIYQRALLPGVLQYSVEMWQLFLEFVKGTEMPPERKRSFFETAINTVGQVFNSDAIWTLYLGWEESEGNIGNVSRLFARILSTPIKGLENAWQNFTEHIGTNSIEEAITPQESEDLERETRMALDNGDIVTADDIRRFKRKWCTIQRQKAFEEAQERASQIMIYEMSIHQPYFHFKQPSSVELANWSEYLSFEEQMGGAHLLYERCVIPCALCSEFWLRYASFIGRTDGHEAALALLRRPLKSALQSDPHFIGMAALFFESINEEDAAQELFTKLQEFETSSEAVVARAMREIRLGSNEKALEILESVTPENSTLADFTFVSSVLFELGQPINEEALSKDVTDPNALALLIKVKAKKGDNAGIGDVYQQFLTNPNTALEDKARIYPFYLQHHRKMGSPIDTIRTTERMIKENERALREHRIKERRNAAKDVYNLSDTLYRWMTYLRDSDQIFGQQGA